MRLYRQAETPAVPDLSTADPDDYNPVTLTYTHPVAYTAPGTYTQIVEGEILFFDRHIDLLFIPG